MSAITHKFLKVDGLEDRLKSRLGWGLPVVIEPPELETRVAILLTKAASMNHDLNEESAFFIAQKVRSNVRELEGALKRVIANSNFTGRPISVDLIKDSLKRGVKRYINRSFIENLFEPYFIAFKKFGAIPVDRKMNSGQYDSVVKELIQRDNFLLIITPEGRFDATRFRSSY